MESAAILKVRLLTSARATDKEFSYLCPQNVSASRGFMVKVPFGKGNRETFGIVTGIINEPSTRELKAILEVLPTDVSMNEELMGLCAYLQEHFFCTFGEAAKAIIPSPVYKIGSRSVRYLSLAENIDPDRTHLLPKGKNREKYHSLIQYLALCRSASEKVCRELFSLDSSGISLLEKKGLIVIEKEDEFRDACRLFDADTEHNENFSLSDAQERAFQTLRAQYDTQKASAALLHGITGSGKTGVMLALCDHVLKSNRTVLFLVPEIALTGQSARLLIRRYGEKVAIIHSALSEGERRDAYIAIRRGEKPIVLGTRSAVFAPLDRLGLILIDEEQDQSYKSDTQLKYHARDIARYRCAKNNAMLLLSSATPDIESYYKAKSGIYSLVELTERYGSARLPDVKIVDVRPDLRRDPSLLVGSYLREEIRKNLERKEQTILLMNRRGYRRFVSCYSCGAVIKCPNCSVALTVHNASQKRLSCHYCGYAMPLGESCPECHEEHLAAHGYGIQQLEEELHALFPSARLIRLDSDTLTGKGSHEALLASFRKKEADILIGTQMVAKGHNFPDVTLVGIVSADSALYLSDYRAGEHAFSLLTQVIGRAGRADKEGRAVIQTLNPHHNVFSLAAEQDYPSFYEGEIALRKAFSFPPFCQLAVFTLSGEKESAVTAGAAVFSKRLEQALKTDFSDVAFVVYGPFEAPVYRLKNQYRKRFIIKYKNNPNSRRLLKMLLAASEGKTDKIKLTLDIAPGVI